MFTMLADCATCTPRSDARASEVPLLVVLLVLTLSKVENEETVAEAAKVVEDALAGVMGPGCPVMMSVPIEPLVMLANAATVPQVSVGAENVQPAGTEVPPVKPKPVGKVATITALSAVSGPLFCTVTV